MTLRAALLSLGVLAAALPASAETLDDAIARALTGDPSIQSARTALDAAAANLAGARAERLPNLSGSVSYGASWNDGGGTRAIDTNGDGLADTFISGGDQTSESGSAGLDVSQTLFSGGRVSANIAAARAEEERTRANVRAQEDALILAVVQAYSSVLYGEQAVSIRREEVERLTQEVEAANVRFEVGAATRTDVYQSEAQLAAARSALAAAQADLASARASYVRRVGAAPGTLEKPIAPSTPQTLPEAIDTARARAPEIDAAFASVSAAEARRRSAVSGYLPSLSLSVGATRRGEDGFDNFDDDSASLSARVSIPLFTFGRTGASVAAARANERGARYALEDVKRAAEEKTAQAWARLDSAKRRAEASRAQLEAAAFAARGAELERREGLRTQLELLTQIQQERDAALAVAQAEQDVLTAAYALLSAAGAVPRPPGAPTPP